MVLRWQSASWNYLHSSTLVSSPPASGFIIISAGTSRIQSYASLCLLKAPFCWEIFIWPDTPEILRHKEASIWNWICPSVFLVYHLVNSSVKKNFSVLKEPCYGVTLWWSHNLIVLFALELNVSDASQSERSHQEENQPRNLTRYSLLGANGAKILRKGCF